MAHMFTVSETILKGAVVAKGLRLGCSRLRMNRPKGPSNWAFRVAFRS